MDPLTFTIAGTFTYLFYLAVKHQVVRHSRI
jgi:hypothetical protein